LHFSFVFLLNSFSFCVISCRCIAYLDFCFSFSHFSFDFDIFLSFSVWLFSFDLTMSSHVVDDRAAAFLEEVRRAMEVSRQEAGVPAPTVAPSLADVAAAVRESGLAGALNNIAARTISHGVRFFIFY
jgi:hypothetical protein